MAKYRKRPVVVEAFQYRSIPGQANFAEWPEWAKAMLKHNVDGLVVARDNPAARTIEAFPDYLEVRTLEGVMRANDGDWVIRGVRGEIYPCKPDIFEATYEPAEGAH